MKEEAFPFPHLLDLYRLNTARQVVETLHANDGVRQPGLAQQFFPPRVVVALRVIILQSLPKQKNNVQSKPTSSVGGAAVSKGEGVKTELRGVGAVTRW